MSIVSKMKAFLKKAQPERDCLDAKCLELQNKLNAMTLNQARIASLSYINEYNIIFCARRGVVVSPKNLERQSSVSMVESVTKSVKSTIDLVLKPLDVTLNTVFVVYDFLKNTEIVLQDRRLNLNTETFNSYSNYQYQSSISSNFPHTLELYSTDFLNS